MSRFYRACQIRVWLGPTEGYHFENFEGDDCQKRAIAYASEQQKAGRSTKYFRDDYIRCDCGDTVGTRYFTNTCTTCGADYNAAGQRLAPRSQWGEETGEHWTECY